MPEKLIPINNQQSEKNPSANPQTLPAPLRHQMEVQFGQDFSGVRIHQGTSAANAAGAFGAKAFSIGSNIHFGAGQYQPGTEAGQKLIAHELAHLIQQSRGCATDVPEGTVKIKTDE